MTNSFTKADDKGRNIWYSTISGSIQDIKFTENPFDGVDGYMTGQTGIRSVLEIKNRDIPSDKYDEVLIEKKKYNTLLQKKETYKTEKALFINIFRDKYIIWDISSIKEPKWHKVKCTAHTADGTYTRGEKEKEVGFLKKEDALWIKER